MSQVALRGEEREVALAELAAVRKAVSVGDYQETLDDLIAALEHDDPLDADQAGELDRILGLALQSGRVRAIYGPGGEQAALKAFRKLPTGTELGESARQVSEALSSLAGRSLDGISITAVGPGSFTLSLTAGGSELTVRLDRQGARLASVGA
jgi:hypothetical protein